MVDPLAQLIVLLLLLILAWVFVIRPQQRRVRAHREFVAQIQVGDEVVTTAGVYGTVTRIEPDVVGLEVASGVEITVARLAIGRPQPLSAAEQRAADDSTAGASARAPDQIENGLVDDADRGSADAPADDPKE